MKKYLFFILLIFVSAACCFAGGKKESIAPHKAIVKFIVFDKKTGAGNRMYEKVRTAADTVKAGYLEGYTFAYNKNGAVQFTVNATVSGEGDKKITQEIVTVNNEEYVCLKGVFEYTTPAVPEKVEKTGPVSVKSDSSIYALYGRLMSTAVKDNCKPGTSGIIYPYGDLDYHISASSVMLKGSFLIYRK
ncbi:MAG: hypothetical protein JW874_07775 [Spirochaetales bacterium]|nr:hypothetical protein [Spirochaetales bacterium]